MKLEPYRGKAKQIMQHRKQILAISMIVNLLVAGCASEANKNVRIIANSNKTDVVVIANSKIIDVKTGSIKENLDVIITRNLIYDIVPAKNYSSDTTVIDASTYFVIPGLWDMHAHTLSKRIDPDRFTVDNLLMLANGVTGFRDMWGELRFADSIRQEMGVGNIPFQRFSLAGNLVDGIDYWGGNEIATSQEEAIKLVDSLYNKGATFIKVYSHLEPEVFHAIAKRCRELEISFGGHVPMKVTLVDAVNAGMKSIEHLTGFSEALSTHADSIAHAVHQSSAPTLPRHRSKINRLLLSGSLKIDEVQMVTEALEKNGTYLVPTLVTHKGYAHMDILNTIEGERIGYLSDAITDYWFIKNRPRLNSITPKEWLDKKRLYDEKMRIIGLLRKQARWILAGSDFPNPYCYPGFGLHDELSLLVEGGLSPLEALQSATLNPARYYNKVDSIGSIEKGKLADIVILRKNPLEDITNIRTVEMVICNGVVYARAELNKFLEDAVAISSQ